MKKIEKKVVFITGAAKGGIGDAVVDYYAPHNDIIVASKNMTAARIPKADLAIKADCTTSTGIEIIKKAILNRFEKIDIFINCIGGSLGSYTFENLTQDFFEKVIAVNLTSAVLLDQMVSKVMIGGGSIVHIVSSAAYNPSITKLPYGIAKAGLIHYIRSAAKILADKNIKINGISPTYVFTKRHLDELEAKAKKKEGMTIKTLTESKIADQPLQREIYPTDLVPYITFAVQADLMTGKIIHVTGGKVF